MTTQFTPAGNFLKFSDVFRKTLDDNSTSKERTRHHKVKHKKKKKGDWLGRKHGKVNVKKKKVKSGTLTVPGTHNPRSRRKRNVYIRFVF